MAVAHCVFCIALMLYTLSGALRIPEAGDRSPAFDNDPKLQLNFDTALIFHNVIDRTVTNEIDTLVQHDGLVQHREPTLDQITLLTSLFLRGETTSLHYDELMGALAVNMHNPYISNIHVLLEVQSNGDSECKQFHSLLEQASKSGSRKMVCAPVQKQPTYHDFFIYANTTLRNTNVLLANTDVVFDASLSLINLTTVATGTMGYVFSVLPPPYAGEYHKLFGKECDSVSRCTVGAFDGWPYGGNSWDAYLFHSPLPAMNSSHLDHFMNTLGGENRAGYQLEVTAGVKLFNPCKHVNAFHWHCIGGSMHHTEKRVDSDGVNVHHILPCWDCPGVGYAFGHSPSASLCQQGILQAIKLDELKQLFQDPSQVQACLQNDTEESMLLDRWRQGSLSVNICHSPTDTNCFVVNYGALNEHEYYR